MATSDRGMELLEQLAGLDWFCRTGSFAGSEDTKPAADWSRAFASSQSDDWKDLKLEFANQIRERLTAVSKDLYNTWNAVVRPLKARLAEVVEPPVREYLRSRSLPAAILSTVQWDVLHAAVEAHFGDVLAPGMYSKMFKMYREGFFPCGWDGVWPWGVMLVL